MSGHSKWSQIKRQKGVTDAKRGQVFTRLGREIMVAAKEGGGDAEMNFRLRLAVQRARDANMPLENIERAIKRATGEGGEGATVLELTYEGYTPGGAAVFVQTMTDNKNRTAAEVRRVFSRSGGNLGETGCVGWIFHTKGVLTVAAPAGKADDIALAAIDAGAEDVKTDDGPIEVYTPPQSLEQVRDALTRAGASIESSEVQHVPSNTVPLDPANARLTLHMLEQLEELDDVQKVFTNADFPAEVLAEAAG